MLLKYHTVINLTFRIFLLMLTPSINTSPEVALSSPVKISKVVVFPAPLNPSKPKHSLFWIATEIFLTAKTDVILKYI